MRKEDELNNDDMVFEPQDKPYEGTEDTIRPEDKIKELREKLALTNKEKQEYLEGWQRAKADLVNGQRRATEESARQGRASVEKLLKKLIPALDGFDQAIQSETWQDVDETWRGGMEQVHTQILKGLERADVAVFDPVGEAFDPAYHETVATIETDDPTKDHVVRDTFARGYRYGDLLIRPAKVRVYILKD